MVQHVTVRLAGSAIIAGVRPQGDLVAAGGPQFEAALASHLTGNRLAGGAPVGGAAGTARHRV
jgi:hypothetical protein